MDFAIITPLSIAIGFCIGYQIADTKHRKWIMAELEAERHVMKDALKAVSETHNNVIQTQANIDQRLMDAETKLGFLIQGTKR